MKKSLIVLAVILMAAFLAFADVSGTWNVQGSVAGAPQRLVLTIGSAVLITGTVDGVALTHGGYNGNDVWFTALRNGVTYSYKGTLNGNSLTIRESGGTAIKTYTYTRAGA